MVRRPAVTRHVLPTAEVLATSVAQRLANHLLDAQRSGRIPAISLTGGTIAAAVHHALGRVGPRSGVDWSAVDFWWGDERFVPAAAADRNDAEVLPLLAALGADPARVHPMPAYDADGPGAAAERYGAELRRHGTGEFEVVMLGVGDDGHVASLFPHHPALRADDRIAVGVSDSPKPPPERVSLTLPALNRSREVWIVASGAGKAAAVAAALRDGPVADVPARGARGRLATRYWLDEAAAGR